MALSAPFNVAEHIEDAFERIQFDPAGLTPRHITSAKRSIRSMLAEWNNDSVDFWKVVTEEHVQTLGEREFDAPDGTIDIIDVSVKRDVYLTPMMIISESDWFAIPDKDVVQGMATRIWVERRLPTFKVHVYPFAENSTDIIVYNRMVQFNDSTILAGSPDIPPLWQACFTAGLTAYLAEKFAPAIFADKMALYGGPGYKSSPGQKKSAYEIARWGNRERGDTIFAVHKARRPRR